MYKVNKTTLTGLSQLMRQHVSLMTDLNWSSGKNVTSEIQF